MPTLPRISLVCQCVDVSLCCSSVAKTGHHLLCGAPDVYNDKRSLIGPLRFRIIETEGSVPYARYT